MRIVPARLDPRALPGAAVVQDEDQSALVAQAGTLHAVEVVVDGCVLVIDPSSG